MSHSHSRFHRLSPVSPLSSRHSRLPRLVKIVASSRQDKKWMALFQVEGTHKTVHFGSRGMDDYTITHDKEQRARYRARHARDLQTNDPTRAGFLSMFVLWGDSTSREENIAAYVRKFRL
jgi:hypothetical protein